MGEDCCCGWYVSQISSFSYFMPILSAVPRAAPVRPSPASSAAKVSAATTTKLADTRNDRSLEAVPRLNFDAGHRRKQEKIYG